jgi:hypothetical protein
MADSSKCLVKIIACSIGTRSGSTLLIIIKDHIPKIRPIREDLDAAVSSQEIIQKSG